MSRSTNATTGTPGGFVERDSCLAYGPSIRFHIVAGLLYVTTHEETSAISGQYFPTLKLFSRIVVTGTREDN